MKLVTDYIFDAPVPVIGPACVLAFVVPAIIGLWLVHVRIHQRIKVGDTLIDNGVVGWFFSGVLTIYGITLGLIAINTWEDLNRVSDIASREAATIAALYRDSSGFGSPLGDELRTKLRDYTRLVIEKVWPAQRACEILHDDGDVLDAFQSQLYSNEPMTERLRIVQAEMVRTYNDLVELRRQRTEAVTQGVPGVVWAVVLMGGALAIGTSYCFQVPFRLHALLATSLAAMIGFLVFLITALDHPYRGGVTVEPTAYQIVLDGVMASGE